MRHVDRSAVGAPQYLVSDQAHFFRQTLFDLLTDTRRAEQTRVDKERLDLNEPTVALALEELFHGKCAFCEQRGRLQPYRFRPPGQALPQLSKETGHLYYAWLAEAFQHGSIGWSGLFFNLKTGRAASIPVSREAWDAIRPAASASEPVLKAA